MNKDKVRTMIRSILPSTWRGAPQAKALRKRAVRHGVRIDVRCENAEETVVDLCRDVYVRDIVRDRRGADKLEHFMRWCEALTKGMSHAEKLSTIKALLPSSLIGEHAYEHWKAHCDPRWSRPYSYRTHEQELQSSRDSLRFRLRRALATDPTLLGRLNAAIKNGLAEDQPRRMLFGVHDIDDYALYITAEPHWDQERITLKLIEAIEGGREAALDRLMGLLSFRAKLQVNLVSQVHPRFTGVCAVPPLGMTVFTRNSLRPFPYIRGMRMIRLTAALLLAASLPLLAQPAPTPEWVKRSNQNAAILLAVQARFNPEQASRFGVEGHDADIFQLPLDLAKQENAANAEAIKQLEAKLAEEKDPAVRQDLKILIESGKQNIEGNRLNDKYDLPFFNLSQLYFLSLSSLLDDRVAPERRPAAVVRIRKYAGMEKGFIPITQQAMAYTRARFGDKSLRGPFKDNLEKDLGNSARYVSGVEDLLKKYNPPGWEGPFAELKKQVAEYDAFLRAEVLPRATTDFKLPSEEYAFALRQRGNDMPVEELISRAKTSFREIQNEMNALAPLVAKEKGITARDYRDVIRELKKQQLAGEAILPHYQARIKQIEGLIAENHLVTLPKRPMQFRIASAAETAAVPAPHVDPPRLIGNTGEQAAFVLPLRIPNESGKQEVGFDDFTFDAASWTLTAHEGRPGHDLQFASILEKGVSQARVLFAFNSVNVEGWALYAEAEMKPLEPLDGQLIALQHRLMRAARAFLDPSLQLGRMTRQDAFHVLEDEVILSHAMALQEVERYTFWAPGQAPSYFVGYSRLMELRTDVERIQGDKFNKQSYHDFVLAQGLVPPALLREAVMNEYLRTP